MKKLIALSIAAVSAAALAGCASSGSRQPVKGFDTANLDTTSAPGIDFYQYACGGWMVNNPLKPEYSRFGTFDQLGENSREQLRVLVDEITSEQQKPGSVQHKIARMYTMGLDSVKLNADGADPIREELAEIGAIASKADLTRMVARLQKEGMSPYFSLYVDADEKNSCQNIVMLYQGGLSMGDRDYYFPNDENGMKIREAYEHYVKRLFSLAGYTEQQAAEAAAGAIKVEDRIASVSYSREQLREPQDNYHKIPVTEFEAMSGLLDWPLYFGEMGLSQEKELDVKQIRYYQGLNEVMKDITPAEQKAYLSYKLLDEAASFLSDDFIAARFDFYGRAMSGTQEQQPRWRRALGVTNGALSEAIGQMYVERYFPASSKEKMLTLVKNLQQALSQRIDSLEWMSDATKERAQEKLASFIVKVGYPDTWRDYSDLEIKDDSYWANVRRSNIFSMDYMLSFAGKPVDKTRWLMSPQTVNAYYNPTTNEICFPAAILQPPFFNPDADDAVNYGAIGVVIGHEMTHGFDDQGRNYDKDGNMTDWWTAEDAAKFTERAKKLGAQYDAIIVLDTVHANGSYTMGENIADHGGLLVAYTAYKNSLEGKEEPQPIDGFTDDQRFFLGYATLWAQNVRDEEILRLTRIDPHSLGKWRVNAALRNIDPFYQAWGIGEGAPMYMAPEERVVIW